MYLSVGAFASVSKCRSFGAQSTFICVYPGFHIGLCPHSTLGYAGVSCLKALVISLNVENNTASTAQYNGIEFYMRLPCTNVRVSVCEIVIAFPILKTSAEVSRKYYVLTNLSTRTY